jgi:hypothetical protein
VKNLLNTYREYRAAKAKSKAYKIARSALLLIAAAFVFLLVYPQVLFAHEVSLPELHGLLAPAAGPKHLPGARQSSSRVVSVADKRRHPPTKDLPD